MRRKEANPNRAPDKIAEKKEKKAQRDAERVREDRQKMNLLYYGGGGLAALAVIMISYSSYTILNSNIPTIQLDDSERLKDVFFGGHPWMVLCSNENMTVAPAFVSAAKKASLTGTIRYGVIDCAGKLPSNKTFFQRFKQSPVNFTKTPTGYLFANSDPPAKIPEKYMLDPKKMSDWADKASKPSVREIAWASTFAKQCTGRDSCVMLHTMSKYTTPEWFKDVMARHRGMPFVSINRKMHKTSFDDKVRAPRKDDTPRLAVMTRKKKGEEDFEYAVTPYRGEWSKGPVGAFVTDIAAKRGSNTDSAVLEDVPWFDKPPKGYQTKETKETGDENKKWREEQKRKRQSGGGGGGGGTGGSNGGRKASKEDEAVEAESKRLRAVREAERQLEDDDDMVVTDLDEDDDGFV